jgi:hypothetical protein
LLIDSFVNPYDINVGRKKGAAMKRKLSLSANVLRLGLLLVVIGLFAPICCDLNGYRIAQGILGNAKRAGNAIFLSPMEDLYGYVLLGVFVLAILGIVFTFLSKMNLGYVLGSLCLAASLVLLLVLAFRIKSLRDSWFAQIILKKFSGKVRVQIGGYSMGLGYLVGVIGFALRKGKIIQ